MKVLGCLTTIAPIVCFPTRWTSKRTVYTNRRQLPAIWWTGGNETKSLFFLRVVFIEVSRNKSMREGGGRYCCTCLSISDIMTRYPCLRRVPRGCSYLTIQLETYSHLRPVCGGRKLGTVSSSALSLSPPTDLHYLVDGCVIL